MTTRSAGLENTHTHYNDRADIHSASLLRTALYLELECEEGSELCPLGLGKRGLDGGAGGDLLLLQDAVLHLLSPRDDGRTETDRARTSNATGVG